MRELEQISLDGFAPPFTLGTYDWGVAALHNGDAWKEHRYSMETLAMFDHDYLGVHLYAQVWDYGMQQDPDQRWQFLLFLHRPSRFIGESGCVEYSTWEWTVQREYSEWATYSVVGDDVDAWVRAPDHLRFILE